MNKSVRFTKAIIKVMHQIIKLLWQSIGATNRLSVSFINSENALSTPASNRLARFQHAQFTVGVFFQTPVVSADTERVLNRWNLAMQVLHRQQLYSKRLMKCVVDTLITPCRGRIYSNQNHSSDGASVNESARRVSSASVRTVEGPGEPSSIVIHVKSCTIRTVVSMQSIPDWLPTSACDNGTQKWRKITPITATSS